MAKYESNPAVGAFSASDDEFNAHALEVALSCKKDELEKIVRSVGRALRGPRGHAFREAFKQAYERGETTAVRELLPQAMQALRGQVRLGHDASNSLFQFGAFSGMAVVGGLYVLFQAIP